MAPTPEELELIPRIKEIFEGREAIYQEWGMLRVRVLNIRHQVAERKIYFDVEEIRTPGLGVGHFKSRSRLPQGGLFRWDSFVFFDNMSTKYWGFEQTGANFMFDSRIIAAIVSRAVRLPEDMDALEAYRQLGEVIWDLESDNSKEGARKETFYGERIFPEDAELKAKCSRLK